MLIGFLSDAHSNLFALEAVVADLDTVKPDQVAFLGDFVGYGPHPNETTELLLERAKPVLAGNHDLAAVGRLEIEGFNPHARIAIEWTGAQLTSEVRDALQQLPSSSGIEGALLAHASPRFPVTEYLNSAAVAAANFSAVDFITAVVGHTHVPAVFVEREGTVQKVDPGVDGGVAVGSLRSILNPGSIGQPRDGDPRASWGLWDSEAGVFETRRVEYPIELTQKAILAAGLPEILAYRLTEGW